IHPIERREEKRETKTKRKKIHKTFLSFSRHFLGRIRRFSLAIILLTNNRERVILPRRTTNPKLPLPSLDKLTPTNPPVEMASQGGSSRRSLSVTTSSLHGKKKSMELGERGLDTGRRSLTVSRSPLGLTGGERTVKRLRLSKAITVPATTTIYDACKNMASRKVDALLLTDSNEMLCGILTDRDIATRVISQEVNVEETPVSKVMTRNPMFVLSETLAVDALQKMVLGKFRHLPVVENGEVIALLDIAKCLYDAIARMERAAEKGKAIAAAVEGVERSWGTNTSVHNTFIETLRDRMFRPSLSTIIPDDSKVLKVSPADTVLTVAKKMVELQSSCAVVMIEDKLGGIFTSKDILMRVVAENLPPSETTMEQVMTQNPESTSVDTPIVEALHIMHEGKFLHLPVTDKEGDVVAVVDVIHVTHAAVATAGTTAGIGNEATNTMMQTFWDSAMALSPNEEDEDTRSESSLKVASEAETGKSLPLPNKFSFKIEDKKHRMHRFISDTRSLTEVVTAILQRLGDDIDPDHIPQIFYEDEDHDKVLLASDSDLQAAIDHAKSIGWKSLRLHLDDSRKGKVRRRRATVSAEAMEYVERDGWGATYSGVAAGAALVAGLGFMAYLKRAGQ
uniref:CBS domain-containing protein n=1 Tax=Brassica oleracea var. oleracea TaxID=109376 RepID=A0A0D3E219_BRAOL